MPKPDFKSEYFDTVDDLVRAKDDAWTLYDDRRERLETVRRFTNMMNTLSDEEAEQLGRTEITNHGLTHRNMLQNETQFTSMVTVTNSLVEVLVDTDNPEQDLVMGQRISTAINRGVIHHKGRFANFWRKVAGEIVIAGGAPVVMPKRYGWLPTIATDMFFPSGSSLDAENIPYAFRFVELNVDDLKKLQKSIKDGKGKKLIKDNIDALLEEIKRQVKDNTKDGGSNFAGESTKAVRESSRKEDLVTIDAWWLYEVKYKENGDQYVSATLFVDEMNGIEFSDTSADAARSAARVISYDEEAYSDVTDWLHFVHVDSEIGGVKNFDTLRGVAEMTYPSNLEMEELLNLMLEGDKIRARPKVTVKDGADIDAVAKWDIVADSIVPAGVEEMPFKNDSRGLMTPMNMLNQNSSGMLGGAVSNNERGGELRQQALERQQNTAMLQTNRVSEAFNHLDSILESIVWRILTSEVRPGTEGYHEIMWVREYLEKYGIDYKKLAKRKHGRFEFIRVRARRSIGNGDRQQQLDTSDWLMSNVMNYEPAARPLIIHHATVLRTQDPDLTDAVVKVPQAIINAQKITAENEYDTIRRRAVLGQILPLGSEDVHQDHIPIHLLDMQAHVARHSMRPWDKLDVLQFAGMVEHVSEHLKVLQSNVETNVEAKQFIPDYQNIVQAAQAIVQEVEEREGSDEAQLTPKEQADLELKVAQMELEARKFGLAVEEGDALRRSRAAREALSRRTQFVREVNEDRRLRLDEKRIAVQSAAVSEKTKQPNE